MHLTNATWTFDNGHLYIDLKVTVTLAYVSFSRVMVVIKYDDMYLLSLTCQCDTIVNENCQ